MRRLIATTAAVGATLLAAAGVASAAQPPAAGPQTNIVTCGADDVTLLVPPAVGTQDNDNIDVWGVGRVVGGGHLIPVAFSFDAVDTTLSGGYLLFTGTDTKGNGNGNGSQDTIECTQTEGGTVADVLQGEPLPQEWQDAGVQSTDSVEFTFTVTAVPKL